MSSHYDENHDPETESPSNSTVLNKYKTAGEIATDVIKTLSAECLIGASIYELCRRGDNLIVEKSSNFYKKQEIKKGIAFPTCISPNNVIAHNSPLKSDADYHLLDGDMVKIDLGVHIDGYVACLATTVIVGACSTNVVDGVKADLMMGAYQACELALKCFKPEKTNHEITDVITMVAQDYECRPIEGLMSYDTYKNVLEGDKRIVLNLNENAKKDYEKTEFKAWEVYYVDVFLSNSDESKAKQKDTRTTVYRRNGAFFSLKMKNSRDIFNSIMSKHQEFAFSLAEFEEENKAKLGIKECIDHNLMISYPVLTEKEGVFVSHFKFTAVIGPKGPIKITFPPFYANNVKSSHKIKNPKLLAIMGGEKKKN